MMRDPSRYLTALVVILALGGAASAQPPPDLDYQGRLLDSAEEPLPGPVNLQIRIFDQPSDGTQLYAEDHQGVALQDGVFNVLLGTGTNPQGSFGSQLFEGTNRWLEVVVNGEVLEPRQPFSSVAYAFQSQVSQLAAVADTLDGLEATALDQSAHVGDPANPHGVTAAQVGAATTGDVDAAIATHEADMSAHHAKTTSFRELTDQVSDAQIPEGITRDSELSGLQERVSDSCPEGSAIRAIDADGTVTCHSDVDTIGFLSCMTVTESVDLPLNTLRQLTPQCPAGFIVTGGGHSVPLTTGTSVFRIRESGPAGLNSYRCRVVNQSNFAQTLECKALCCRVQVANPDE